MSYTMKASILATVVALNNRGVDCFSDDIGCASKCFREALGILRKDLEHSIVKNQNIVSTCPKRSPEYVPSPLNRSEPNQSVETQARAIAVENATNSTTTQQPHPSMPLTRAYIESSSSSALPVSSLYISTRPVTLEASSVDRERTGRRAIIATLVVSFNLGLAHQLMSFTSSQERAGSDLRSAIAFYEVALTLERKLPSNKISGLGLPILNNIAVLYDQVGNYGRAQVCFERLGLQINRSDANSTTNDTKGFVCNIAMIETYLSRNLSAATA
jgi:tetratricopeptide (TPR) repeat protein